MSGEGGLRTACAKEMDAVCRIVSAARCDLTTEKATQRDVEVALLGAIDAAAVSREHRLAAGDIVDFLVFGTIALEVKGPRHTAAQTLRQLGRYAAHERVSALILATSRAMHMPGEIGGKPCRVINLGRAWL